MVTPMLRMKVKVRVAKSQGLHARMKVFDGGGAAAESELARPPVQIATIWRKWIMTIGGLIYLSV
jgi:hypothetical protein